MENRTQRNKGFFRANISDCAGAGEWGKAKISFNSLGKILPPRGLNMNFVSVLFSPLL